MLAHKMLFQLSAQRCISPDPAEPIAPTEGISWKSNGLKKKLWQNPSLHQFHHSILWLSLAINNSSSFIYLQITLEVSKALTSISQTKYIYYSLWSLFSHSLKSPILNKFHLVKLARTSAAKSIYTQNKDTKSVKNSLFQMN